MLSLSLFPSISGASPEGVGEPLGGGRTPSAVTTVVGFDLVCINYHLYHLIAWISGIQYCRRQEVVGVGRADTCEPVIGEPNKSIAASFSLFSYYGNETQPHDQ
jgi:hypothetical protein